MDRHTDVKELVKENEEETKGEQMKEHRGAEARKARSDKSRAGYQQ